ncbi:MAG: NUDIX domain-containing protein [Streptosporangiaceae bacterium]
MPNLPVPNRFQVVPAAYVLLRRGTGSGTGGDEVLLQLRQGTGYMDGHWAAAAAGHVEDGESVLAAACRETVEELGIAIDPADLVPLTGMHRTRGTHEAIDERVDFFFECRRWAGEPRLVEPEKAADLRWFALAALPDPVVPHELFVLERLRGDHLPAVVTYGF